MWNYQSLLYWSSICTFIRRGTMQNVFNFYFYRNLQDLIENISASIMRYQKNRFKINFGFGFVLRDVDTKEFCYYHVSNNNLDAQHCDFHFNQGRTHKLAKQFRRTRFSR